MRRTAIGLEVHIDLSREELDNLINEPLEGELNFYDIGALSNGRRIEFSVQYSSKQREFLKVITEPKGVYFGEAGIIYFLINPEYYDLLAENGCFESRFHTGGKLEMKLA